MLHAWATATDLLYKCLAAEIACVAACACRSAHRSRLRPAAQCLDSGAASADPASAGMPALPRLRCSSTAPRQNQGAAQRAAHRPPGRVTWRLCTPRKTTLTAASGQRYGHSSHLPSLTKVRTPAADYRKLSAPGWPGHHAAYQHSDALCGPGASDVVPAPAPQPAAKRQRPARKRNPKREAERRRGGVHAGRNQLRMELAVAAQVSGGPAGCLHTCSNSCLCTLHQPWSHPWLGSNPGHSRCCTCRSCHCVAADVPCAGPSALAAARGTSAAQGCRDQQVRWPAACWVLVEGTVTPDAVTCKPLLLKACRRSAGCRGEWLRWSSSYRRRWSSQHVPACRTAATSWSSSAASWRHSSSSLHCFTAGDSSGLCWDPVWTCSGGNI